MDDVLSFLIENKVSVRYRDFIIDLFTECEIEAFPNDPEIMDLTGMTYTNPKKDIYFGKMFSCNNEFYYFSSHVKDHSGSWGFKKLPFSVSKMPLLRFKDKFMLNSTMIENHSGEPIETTVGLFITNQLLLVDPFGSSFEYINSKWDINGFERKIAEYVLEPDDKIEIDKRMSQAKKYINNIFFIGSWSLFAVPGLSKKSLGTSKEVMKRRDELLEEHKDHLDDPIVMIKIENELKDMDRKYIEGDVSMGFFGDESKVFDVQRKKMFLLGGMTETFGDESKDFNFVKGNLDTGWRKEELPILFNDITKGVYERGIETAKGGAETKFFGRQFQESKIVEDDCGSTDGILLTLDESNKNKFLNRHVILNGKTLLITKKNIDSYIGKEIKIRSPQFCNSKTGYCYTCMDYQFKKLGLIKLNVLPISITSAFLLQSMKSMHGKSVSSYEVNSLSKFTTS